MQSGVLFVPREALRDGSSNKITDFRDLMPDFKDKAGTVHKSPKIVDQLALALEPGSRQLLAGARMIIRH
jgi:hypothetical protein